MEGSHEFSDTLIFAKKDKIIEFDYGDDSINVLQEFDKKGTGHNKLEHIPLFF